MEWDAIFRSSNGSKFTVHTNMNPNIGLLRLFPGITAETVSKLILDLLKPTKIQILLELMGSGINYLNLFHSSACILLSVSHHCDTKDLFQALEQLASCTDILGALSRVPSP